MSGLTVILRSDSVVDPFNPGLGLFPSLAAGALILAVDVVLCSVKPGSDPGCGFVGLGGNLSEDDREVYTLSTETGCVEKEEEDLSINVVTSAVGPNRVCSRVVN